MSEYRRFISYIYNYHNGKKRNNCGFVKVEIRNDICRLGVHLEAKELTYQEVPVYGFVRIQGKALGIRMGSASRRGNAWEMQVSTPSDHFASSEYTMADIKGIWIRTETGDNFITVWDDEVLDPDMFVTELPAQESEEEAETEALDCGEELHVQEDISQSLLMRWDNFLFHYPQISPFDDEEIYQCICIAPKDLSFLPREERQFAVNPFLREGYENYGHLLLGCHAQGRYILAVPGENKEMQDKHLARMCGFPLFKEARKTRQTGTEKNETGKFGYWYHFLNEECPSSPKPEFNQGSR
ncbi:MAG: hypothetical protein Q4F83_15120 [Eubacteriales bacterium]|nr:hypothetical protein [Eubacteriales bacterium]